MYRGTCLSRCTFRSRSAQGRQVFVSCSHRHTLSEAVCSSGLHHSSCHMGPRPQLLAPRNLHSKQHPKQPAKKLPCKEGS